MNQFFYFSETKATLTLIAPLINSFERSGYCTIHVDSRPVDRRRSIMRDTLVIHFDTRIKGNINTDDIEPCKNIDEDPLDDCKPVNCESYYNGKRSYFDKHTKRCVEVPRCMFIKRDNSRQVYDPQNNKCVDEECITNDDIDFIKSLSENKRHPKDILIINSIKRPEMTNENTNLIDSFKELHITNSTNNKISKVKTKILCNSFVQYFLTNKYTLLVLALVVTVQCFLIITMVYCLTNSSACCNKKKVDRKFFNYRQDVSVTTPLIGTSNMDTETTEFDYISESSNIDKKIKCYKACQKEQQAKISMSDDILLKCLNRRDWNSKPTSQMAKEIADNKSTYSEPEDIEIIDSLDDNKDIDDETSVKIERDSDYIKSNSALSEKEIKCHNYNLTQSKVEFKAVDNTRVKEPSVTTDKGAQACFSNDSIDDFLSERGMIFLGEGTSKYSFTSVSSPDKSSMTNLTGKTSKNNIIKNVLSLLSKSKMGTASDPGVKSKGKPLELLHMSHASVFSSSSELKNVKSIKLVKESRSTF